MPKVTIISETSKSAQDSFSEICKMLEDDQELRKLDPKYSCKFDDSKLTGKATGKQFKADLKVITNNGGAMVEIIVDLPFHLALAKGLVKKTLQKKMDKALS